MSQIHPQLLHELQAIAGPQGFRRAAERDTEDPRGRYRGAGEWVFRPDSAETTGRLVARCAEARLPLVPVGGATGLVAGHLALAGGPVLLLSTERLNRIRRTDPVEAMLVAEAGVPLAQVQQAAQAQSMLYPLSLASEGSCTVGGNLATNAGGVQVLRYGNTRDLVLGVEAVLPDGSLMHNLSPLRKDNTGYDLKNLLIGSEGTLGLITAASLKLFPAVREHHTALCPLPSPAHALALLAHLRGHFAESVNAFELIAGQGLAFLREHFAELPQALDPAPPWSVLIELGNSGAGSLQGPFEQCLGEALERGLIDDAVICQGERQRRELWDLREHIPLANARVGAVVSFDISLPLGALADFIDAGRAEIAKHDPALRLNCFGHVGDGNLHFNVFPPAGQPKEAFKPIAAELRRTVYDLVHRRGGSFSAEHGVGRDKVEELARYADPARLAAMRAIKAALDPRGIFNPGALFAPAPAED